MKTAGFALILFVIPLFLSRGGQSPSGAKPIMGFTAARSVDERALETRFDSSLNRDDLRSWMKQLSARPHSVGSAYGKQDAEFIAAQFRSFGFKTEIEEFQVLFPTPSMRVLEMTAPEHFTAKLQEPGIPEDSTSGQQAEQLPTYNAYSIDGDVSGDLVYVNYGIPKDYEVLEAHGIDVKGKIVIARYGGSWRGIKPKVAAEHGATGCIIYSDPADDGYFAGDPYPKGAYRNENGVQRGSVADMPLYPGDPLTPFVGATRNARRLSRSDAPTLTKIPVLPISYADALPLLRALSGPVAPQEWRGALAITYHLGPGPAKVHLKLAFHWDLVPAFDVVARLEGNERPDEWIIRGNHHDAWINGASDPISGQVAMMEEGRGIGQLVKTGWKPKRTIIYCAWDGEEPGLLGSTEWVEEHAEVLKQKAAVYINSDGNGRGFLGAAGSHTLEKFVNDAARDVTDPETHVSVLERARANRIMNSKGDDRKEAREREDLRIGALGSGSDFSPFLQHLGISSLSLGFGGEDGGGSYHSIYDSYDHYVRFEDRTFQYGITMAQTAGRMVLRLADADVLPFEFTTFADIVGKYAKEVAKLVDESRDQTEELNRELRERSPSLAADPQETFVEPKAKDPVPYINFAPLQNALAALDLSAKNFDQSMSDIREGKASLPDRVQSALDEILMKAERSLTRKEGLPRRPWYAHQVYAPGFYTGYSVKTLPGIREAIEQRNWQEAEEEVTITGEVLRRFSGAIDAATKLVVDSKVSVAASPGR